MRFPYLEGLGSAQGWSDFGLTVQICNLQLRARPLQDFGHQAVSGEGKPMHEECELPCQACWGQRRRQAHGRPATLPKYRYTGHRVGLCERKTDPSVPPCG